MAKESVFYPELKMDSKRWNLILPYKLIVWDAVKKSKVKSFGAIKNTTLKHGTDFILTQETKQDDYEYTLPITPQQIQITTPFANNTTPTARGILEEHNGQVFKIINIQATTGIFMRRELGKAPRNKSSVESVFGGTIAAAQNVASAARNIASAFSGRPNGLAASDASLGDLTQTGYYKALELQAFLERYVEAKKNPNNKNWRLVLDIPKTNESYIVSPKNFSINKSANSPNEFMIGLQLQAWKRIDLKANFSQVRTQSIALSTNSFQKFVNTLANVRKLLANSVNVIKAVRSDFRSVFDAIRQITAVVKDLSGVALALSELPGGILQDLNSTISDMASDLRASRNNFEAAENNIANLFANDRASGGGRIILSKMAEEKQQNEGVPSGQTSETIGAKTTTKTQPQQTQQGSTIAQTPKGTDESAAAQVTKNPEENYAILGEMEIDSMKNISSKLRQDINDAIAEIRLIRKSDLQQFKQEILSTIYLISNRYGAGDSTTAYIYGQPTPSTRTTPLTVEETEVMTALMEVVQITDALTASEFFDQRDIVSPMEYVGTLANQAEIDFDDATAKRLVPVPFGLTIEQIAVRYLGDANKWLEIVTLNNLRLPYIDEEGFILPLISNGGDRQINVDDTNDQLYIGQVLTLSSSSVPAFQRVVINKEKISDNNYVITLSGDPNLDILTTSDNAKIKAYLPGTVNSQNQIFIPAEGTPEDEDFINLPKAFRQDNLAKLSKIDWLLDENGDLAITKAGDIQLAGGMTNLIQALKLKLDVKRGSLLQHPEYGLSLKHGISLSEIEAGDLLQSLQELVLQDSRYAAIDRLDLRVSGSTVSIDMAVQLASGSGILPISFQL